MMKTARGKGHKPTWSQSLEKTWTNHSANVRIMMKVHAGVKVMTNASIATNKKSGIFAIGWKPSTTGVR